MGLNSPLHNVKGYSSSRPPLILFVVCLFICASATIGLGFFIQYSETIANPEVKEKWMKFLNGLSAKNYCLTVSDMNRYVDPEPIAQFIDGGNPNSTGERNNETSITVSGSVRLMSPLKTSGGMVAASGDILLHDSFTILDLDHPIKWVRMTFGIPSNGLHHENVCIILTVPTWFLPQSTRSAVCVPTFINKTITAAGNFEIFPSVSVSNGSVFCVTGSPLTLNFNSPEDFYLSKIEKLNIYFHLVHAGYFLFGLAFILICFSFFRKRGYSPVVTSDRVPLTL